MEQNIIKMKSVEILEYFDKFCIENNLSYFVCYGTLLGAIRHGGFIPWDDDIDVVMSREDYEKFLKIHNNSKYKIGHYDNDKNYPYMWSKLYDSTTRLEESCMKKYNMGIFIDIFPVDNWPSIKQYKLLSRYIRMFRLKQYRFSSFFSLKKNFLYYTIKLLTFFLPKHWIYKKINKTLIAIDSIKTDKCAVIVESISDCKVFDKSIFNTTDTIRFKFENVIINIPKRYDDILKILYGDYNKLPPIEQQISNHCFNITINEE